MERSLACYVTVASDGRLSLLVAGSEEKCYKDRQGGLVVAHVLDVNNSRTHKSV